MHGPFALIDAHFIYPDGYAALLLSRKANLPLVVTARGSDINVYCNINGIRQKIQHVLRNAGAIVGVSNALVEKMIDLGAPEERCYMIPNGVDLERFEPNQTVRTGKVLPELLAVGNLLPVKDFETLLNAFALIVKEYPNARLTIVGTGPEKSSLSDRCTQLGIEKNVRFLGQISHDKIHSIFQQAGVFCLTSLREGNPNVVIEALATGLPVAATSVGGVPELIKDGINGFLAKDHRPETIAEAIRNVLKSEWSVQKIRATVEDRSWKKVADEVQAVFEKVVQERKG